MFGRASKTQTAEGPMTVAMKQSQPCQYVFTIHLKAQAVQPVREAVVQEVQREATIAGFRKGKAPKELVEQHHPTAIRDETVRRLTRHVVEQVISDHKLKPVGPFEIIHLEFDEAKGMQLEAQVEVEPDFPLGDYRRIPLKKSSIAVAAEEVAQALSRLQESMAQLVPIPRPQTSGSLAEDPEHTRGTGEGEAKEKQVPALDDEFAKDVGFENVELLKTHLEAKLREQNTTQQQHELEQQLCDALLARHQFELPARLVSRQTERLKREFHARLLLAGLAEEQVQQEATKYEEQVRTNASRHVKLAFIVDRIAEKERLSVTQDEMMDRLWKLATRMGKDPTEVRRLLDAKGLWPSIVSSILQEKTIAWLLSVATVERSEA